MCLYTFRKQFDERSEASTRMLRTYLAGGNDIEPLVYLETQKINLTNTKNYQQELIDVFMCFDKACNFKPLGISLKMKNEADDARRSNADGYCSQHGMQKIMPQNTGINFQGKTLSCDTLLEAFMPCPQPSSGGEINCNLVLGAFVDQLSQPVLPTRDSLQQAYDAFTVIREFLQEDIIQLERARASTSWESAYFTERPYLWQKDMVTITDRNMTRNVTQFRWHGYCQSVDPSINLASYATVFDCDKGVRIQSIDFASFGTAAGICGSLTIGDCSFDIAPDLSTCVGQKNCTVPMISSYLSRFNSLPAHCRDGETPRLQLQLRCDGGPLLASIDGTLGLSYAAVQDVAQASSPRYISTTSAQLRIHASQFELLDETRVRCAIAAARPAMVQAHMCKEVGSNEVDSYVYKGYEADLDLLLESDGAVGRKTVLRLQSLAESNHTVSETQVLLPATNGILISSGNLRDITVESGPITSISVNKKSFLKGGLTVGPLEPALSYSSDLKENVHESWWDSEVIGSDGVSRSRAEGGAKWDWTTGGPWLTLFAPGDCMSPQAECSQDNVDRAIKFNVSDGGSTRVGFEILEGVVSQINFPVSWGIREGVANSVAHSYSNITGGRYSQHLCSSDEVLHPNATMPRCVSRIISTGLCVFFNMHH